MGYESRVYVVSMHDFSPDYKWGEELARLNLSKMGYDGFTSLFNKEKDFTLYADDGNTDITEDVYKEPLTYAELDDVLNWLNANMERRHYRRDKMLYDTLKGFKDTSYWGNSHIVVVHYGY